MTNSAAAQTTSSVDSFGARFHLESGVVRISSHGRHEGFAHVSMGLGVHPVAGEFLFTTFAGRGGKRADGRFDRWFLTSEALEALEAHVGLRSMTVVFS